MIHQTVTGEQSKKTQGASMHLEIPQPSQLNQFSYGSKPWHPGFHTAIAGLLHRSAEEVGQRVFQEGNYIKHLMRAIQMF